jgi:hypothetical protein
LPGSANEPLGSLLRRAVVSFAIAHYLGISRQLSTVNAT